MRRVTSFLAVVVTVAVFLVLGLRAGESWLPRRDATVSPPRGIPGRAPRAEPPFDFAGLELPRRAILPGGPPKDGIPALSAPAVCAVADADFLDADDRVVGVRLNGEVRAYPIRILNHHEAVNDRLGGVPIAVVFCPLCDSVTVIDRRVGDDVLEFGISGLLYNSNVLLFDRRDDALWSQIGLRAVSGPSVGASPRHFDDWELSTFEAWRDAEPASTVMTLETGHKRDYAKSPYDDYATSEELWFPIAREDERLPAKARVIGVQCGDVARAYRVDAIDGAMRDTLPCGDVELRVEEASRRVIVVATPEEAAVIHTFWFAWAATHPNTEVYGRAGSR